jgi:tetratricopeptide (TPR) repeat protein
MGVLLLTYVSARQRVAVYPVFIFFACAAVWKTASLASRSRQIMAAAAAVSLALLLLIKNDAMKEEDHQWKNFLMSQGLYRSALKQREKGLWASASNSAKMALAAAPWLGDSLRPADLSFAPLGFHRGALAIHETLADPDFSTLFDRGFLALTAGELDEAQAIFSKLIDQRRRFKRDQDQSSQPWFYLAMIAAKKGDRASAVDLLARARKEAPGDPEVLALSYALTGKSGFKDQIERYFDALDGDFLIGRAFLEIGDARRALPHLSRLGKLLPQYRRGQVYLAAALAGSGQEEKGVSVFLAALGRRRDPVFLENEILQGFHRWRDLQPASSSRRFFYGQALRQYGHYAAALMEQQEALKLSPGHALVEREIRHLQDIVSGFALK